MMPYFGQAEWSVLLPAVQGAKQLLEGGQHRYIILDQVAGFEPLLHGHVDDFTSPPFEYAF